MGRGAEVGQNLTLTMRIPTGAHSPTVYDLQTPASASYRVHCSSTGARIFTLTMLH